MADHADTTFGFLPPQDDPDELSRAHLLSEDGKTSSGETSLRRRNVIGAVLAGAFGLGAAAYMAPAADPDPIFALISQHGDALDRSTRATRIYGAMVPSAPGAARADHLAREARRAEAADWNRLLGAAPATPEGLRAYAAHLRWSIAQQGDEHGDDAPSRRALLALCDALNSIVASGGL